MSGKGDAPRPLSVPRARLAATERAVADLNAANVGAAVQAWAEHATRKVFQRNRA
jgi:hypothetical protein